MPHSQVNSFLMFVVSVSSETPVGEPKAKKPRLDPFADLRDGASASSGADRPTTSVTTELSTYKALRVPAAHESLLQYWKEQSSEYPILSQVARRLLAISASSAQSERDFSSVGRTVTEARAQLSASKVEALELVRWGLRNGL